MFVMQEFELFEEDGFVLALPFDLEGGTQGNRSRTRQRWLRTGSSARRRTG